MVSSSGTIKAPTVPPSVILTKVRTQSPER